MKNWIKDVLALQQADIKTKKINSRLKEIPNDRNQISNDLLSSQEKVNKAKENLRTTEKEIKTIEQKIGEIKGKIEDIERKSSMVKKNEEYKAFMSEIATQKSFISSLESKEIILYEKLDADKKNLKAAEVLVKNAETESMENQKELSEVEAMLKGEMDKAIAARKPLVDKVDPNVLSIYSRLIKKEGEPLTKINNNTCGYCHLKLTPQTVTDAKKGNLCTCDSCGHMIYASEEL